MTKGPEQSRRKNSGDAYSRRGMSSGQFPLGPLEQHDDVAGEEGPRKSI